MANQFCIFNANKRAVELTCVTTGSSYRYWEVSLAPVNTITIQQLLASLTLKIDGITEPFVKTEPSGSDSASFAFIDPNTPNYIRLRLKGNVSFSEFIVCGEGEFFVELEAM